MKVVVEKSRVIFDDFFKIEEAYLRYQRFDGQMSETARRLNFERGDSVAALVMNTDTRRVLLVNQFKYPALKKDGGWIIETVAGTIEKDENTGMDEEPEAALRREILEEMGYEVANLTFISKFYVSPGGTSERIWLYYAEVKNRGKIAPGGGVEGEHEDIQTIAYSLPELWEALDSGKIMDAKTIIAIMWLRNELGA